MQQSSTIIYTFILIGRGGGSEHESRADTFKIVARNKMVESVLAPTENIKRVFAKTICPVFAKVFCHQQPYPNDLEEITKVNIRAFKYSVGLQQNDFSDKRFSQEEYKCCEVSEDID